MPKFTTDAPYVWIRDPYHPHYPNYVKILEVLPNGYKVQVILLSNRLGPIIEIKEDQLTDELI